VPAPYLARTARGCRRILLLLPAEASGPDAVVSSRSSVDGGRRAQRLDGDAPLIYNAYVERRYSVNY
jgi:hypothetical protein